MCLAAKYANLIAALTLLSQICIIAVQDWLPWKWGLIKSGRQALIHMFKAVPHQEAMESPGAHEEHCAGWRTVKQAEQQAALW